MKLGSEVGEILREVTDAFRRARTSAVIVDAIPTFSIVHVENRG